MLKHRGFALACIVFSEGRSSIAVPPPLETHLVVNGLADFVDGTIVVTATIRSSNTFPSGYYKSELTTWYTVRVTGVLTGDRAPAAPPPGVVPETLLPLAPAELLVAVSGGRLTIDGVDILGDSLMTRRLTVGQAYLLFLEPRGAGPPITAVHGCPLGAYEIRDDSLRPLSSRTSNPAASDIAARFHRTGIELRKSPRLTRWPCCRDNRCALVGDLDAAGSQIPTAPARAGRSTPAPSQGAPPRASESSPPRARRSSGTAAAASSPSAEAVSPRYRDRRTTEAPASRGRDSAALQK